MRNKICTYNLLLHPETFGDSEKIIVHYEVGGVFHEARLYLAELTEDQRAALNMLFENALSSTPDSQYLIQIVVQLDNEQIGDEPRLFIYASGELGMIQRKVYISDMEPVEQEAFTLLKQITISKLFV